MANKHTRQCNTLVRMHEFGVEHKDRFPDTEVVGQAFAILGKAVDELSEYTTSEAAKASASRRDVPKKAVARAALRSRMETVSRTARALAIDTPGVDRQFRIPRGHSDQALLLAARGFAREAAPLAAGFIAHGLAKTFIDQLEASIEAFGAAAHDQASSRDGQALVRVAIEQSLETGLDAARRLEAIVPNYLGNDPALTMLWERACRVEPGRRGKAVVTDPAGAKPATEKPAEKSSAETPSTGA